MSLDLPVPTATMEQLRSQPFPEMRNDLLLRAARGQKQERAPVWIMRQAGRYLPEFRATRKEHPFFEVCQTPQLACEVTLQPIRRYGTLLDASIIFCDILVVLQAMGLEVIMEPGKGPVLTSPVQKLEDLARINRSPDVDKSLAYVYDAITLTRHGLQGYVPLIGFIGAPWTLFAYMVEGSGSKTWQVAKSWLWNHPDESKQLLQDIALVGAKFLIGQARAGAQMLQVFDSHAGELGPAEFKEFCLPYLELIVNKVKEAVDVPVIVFAKGAHYAAEWLSKTRYDVIGLDWAQNPNHYTGKCLQGNFDPTILYGTSEAIEKHVKRVTETFKSKDKRIRDGGWIANLGHGITPAVDPESLRHFLQCVQKYSTV